MNTAENRRKDFAWAMLVIAMVSVSFAAIFVRLSAAPPATVAALRMIFSSAILLPFALSSARFRAELRAIDRPGMILLLTSGSLLAVHFLTWITSLYLTGITSSIVFVTASPLFVALYSVIVDGEKASRILWVGFALAVTGALVMGGGNILSSDGSSWKGDMLAIAGAVAAAGYFLTGSRLRRKFSLLTHLFVVYSVAAVLLAAAVPLAGGSFTGLPARSYLYCLLMAVVCQGAGHSMFNWALKRMSATTVTFSILAEPVGTTLLALLILNEIPKVGELIGGAVILVGIFVVARFDPRLRGDGGGEEVTIRA